MNVLTAKYMSTYPSSYYLCLYSHFLILSIFFTLKKGNKCLFQQGLEKKVLQRKQKLY